MSRFKGLPHWCMTGTRPAFYDTESATTIEMVGRLYASYSELVDDYNKYVDEINKAIMDFETGVISDTTTFKETITKIVHDYIKMIDDKIKIQDEEIAEAVDYMKGNIVYAVTQTVEEMKTSGELAEIVVEGFNDLAARVATTEENITSVDAKAEKNIDDILDLTGRVRSAESTVATMEGKVNQSSYAVDNMVKEVNSVRADMDGITGDIASVKTANTTNTRNITTLTNRVEDAETGLTNLTGKVDTIEDRVEYLEANGGGGGANVLPDGTVVESKSIITGTATGNVAITVGVGAAMLNLVEEQKSGSKFTVENGAIVIGAGVTQVKISACICLQLHENMTGLLSAYIFKNGFRINSSYDYQVASKYYYVTTTIPTYVMPVTAGDRISLYIDTPQKGAVTNNEYGKTQLTIEEV